MEQLLWNVIVPVSAAAVVGSVLCGLIAVISPRTFGAIARAASRRVDTQRWLAWLDKEIDIDRYVLKHARLFGFVTLACILLAVWLVV